MPLIGNFFQQIGVTFAFDYCLEFLSHSLFEYTAHPNHTLEATICGDKFRADQIILAHTHHAWRLQAAAGNTGQCAEGHARWGHAGIFAADNHHAVCLRDKHDNALETPAGSHRILHNGIHGDLLHHTVRAYLGISVSAFPVTFLHVDIFTQLDWLVWTCGIDAERRLAIQ